MQIRVADRLIVFFKVFGGFKRVFLVLLTKKRPILTVLKEMILDEVKGSNGIKPQKINFFIIFCKFLPHKGNFCWKVPSKVM